MDARYRYIIVTYGGVDVLLQNKLVNHQRS